MSKSKLLNPENIAAVLKKSCHFFYGPVPCAHSIILPPAPDARSSISSSAFMPPLQSTSKIPLSYYHFWSFQDFPKFEILFSENFFEIFIFSQKIKTEGPSSEISSGKFPHICGKKKHWSVYAAICLRSDREPLPRFLSQSRTRMAAVHDT